MCHALLAVDRRNTQSERFRNFIETHPGEVSHLGDLCFLRVELCQFDESIVELQGMRTRTAANAVLLAGVIDKNLAHQMRYGSKEKRAILAVLPLLQRKPHIGFIQQCGRLTSYDPLVRGAESCRPAVAIPLKRSGQFIERAFVSIAPLLEQNRNRC